MTSTPRTRRSSTGLYVHGAYGIKKDNKRDEAYGFDVEDKDQFYYLQAGIERKLNALGKTTFWGEFRHDDIGAHAGKIAFDEVGGLGALMAGSEIEFWGIGANQAIDAAAMDMYIAYRNFSADVLTSPTGEKAGATRTEIQDFQQLLVGSIIRF